MKKKDRLINKWWIFNFKALVRRNKKKERRKRFKEVSKSIFRKGEFQKTLKGGIGGGGGGRVETHPL